MVQRAPVHPITSADLGEPVNALVTSLEVVRLACKGSPEVIRALERAERQTRVLCELVERLRQKEFTTPEPCYAASEPSSQLPSSLPFAELTPVAST